MKKCKVQLQNRLVPDGPVQDWLRRIEGLQPDIDRVLQVGICMHITASVFCNTSLDRPIVLFLTCDADIDRVHQAGSGMPRTASVSCIMLFGRVTRCCLT